MFLDRSWPIRSGAADMYMPLLTIWRTVTEKFHINEVFYSYRKKGPVKFDVPAFEGDSTASWLTWSQRVLYQARASPFEDELTAAEGDGLGVRADVFNSSNVDPVRLRMRMWPG